MFDYSWLILILPMFGFVFLSWYGNRISAKMAGVIGCATVGFAFLVTLALLVDLTFLEPEKRLGNVQVLYRWIDSGAFHLNLSILIDPLSVFMLLVVTGVGFVI